MYYLHSLKEAEEVFKALSTPVRLQIMELIYENNHMSMNDLAEQLGVTNSAITMHVSKLEAAGLVVIQTASGKRGVMKIVRPKYTRLIVDMGASAPLSTKVYDDEISVGCYSAIDAHPTCGLATSGNLIGDMDNPKVFSYPEHFKADILWIGYGSVSYTLPNRLKPGETLTELQISLELSSECPRFNDDYPSDIYFEVNGLPVGKWISPGDFGDRKGLVSPNWWPDGLNQYGLLKTIIINDAGTFIDGSEQISPVTINQLNLDYNSDIRFTISAPKDTANSGGLTLFGASFGDYGQNIRFKMYYSEPNT